MKKNIIFKIVLLFSFLFLNNSCTKATPDGLWDDSIKLSQKEVTFSSGSNIVQINTQGEWWWITEVVFNETIINIDATDTSQSSFIIETANFKINRQNATSLLIEMNENTTGSNNILNIGLEAGDYFDSIKITQLAN